jgi:hypothetical protein
VQWCGLRFFGLIQGPLEESRKKEMKFKFHRMQETVRLAQGLCCMQLGIYLLDRHRVSQSINHSVSQSVCVWSIGWLVGSLVIVRKYIRKGECCVSLSQVSPSAVRVGRYGTRPGSSSILLGFTLLIIILLFLHTHTYHIQSWLVPYTDQAAC